MTDQTPHPEEPALDGAELTMLTGFLDYYRAVLRRKAEGLTAEQLRRSVASRAMTIGWPGPARSNSGGRLPVR